MQNQEVIAPPVLLAGCQGGARQQGSKLTLELRCGAVFGLDAGQRGGGISRKITD
jgi:hypothetical protein